MFFGIFPTARLPSLPSVYQRLRVNFLPNLTSLIYFLLKNIEIINHCCIITCTEHVLILTIQTSLAHQILAVSLNYIHWTNLISSCDLDVKTDWERTDQQHCTLSDVQSKWKPTSQKHITNQCHCTFFDGTVRQRCRNRLSTVSKPTPQ